MYISKKDREIIKNKFDNKCAYSGTPLEDDWQVDHIIPIIRYKKKVINPQYHTIDNMVPTQKIINNYKRDLNLESFRNWYLGELHLRLKKLPKNPKSPNTIKRKNYLLKIAELFNIEENKPFNKIFYFETLNTMNKQALQFKKDGVVVNDTFVSLDYIVNQCNTEKIKDDNLVLLTISHKNLKEEICVPRHMAENLKNSIYKLNVTIDDNSFVLYNVFINKDYPTILNFITNNPKYHNTNFKFLEYLSQNYNISNAQIILDYIYK